MRTIFLAVIAAIIGLSLVMVPTNAISQQPTYGAPSGPAGPYNGAQLSQQAGQAAAIDAQRKAIDLAYRRGKAIRDAQKTYQDAVLDAQNKYVNAQLDARKQTDQAKMVQDMQKAATDYRNTVQTSAQTYQKAVRDAQGMK